MNRKIFYIILVALATVVLAIVLWWWFLERQDASLQNTGTFGSAQNAGQTNGQNTGAGGDTNGATLLPGQDTTVAQDTNVQLGDVTGSDTVGSVPDGAVVLGTPVVIQPQGQIGVPGVIWLSGTPVTTNTNSSTNINSPGTVFNPTGINSIAQSNPTGTGGVLPNIGVNDFGQQTTNNSGSALGALGLAAGVGVVTCAIVPAMQAAAQALGFTEGAAKGTAAQAPSAAAQAQALIAVQTFDLSTHLSLQIGLPALSGQIGQVSGGQAGQQTIDQFMGCMARNIAKIMLQQITASVVNWINSGFNGSPSFVQNPSRFLQQTADVAAGNYIQSSALSFLCSPFQLQVRIAIAQSYAQRNANSCTLTQVTKNINNFMRGSFSTAGGWPAFIQFTTMPTNNPYGAFLFASIGVQTAAQTATNQVQNDLLQGSGFLSFKQKKNCRNVDNPPAASPNVTISEVIPADNSAGAPALYNVCDFVTVTPGRVIADALGATEKSSLDQIGLAKSFDEIISALINQLMTRTLQNGLSNLSGAGGYASNFYSTDQLQSQQQGQGLVTQMQQDTNLAVAYASVQQGSIQDIQTVQNQLNETYNCWSSIASTSPKAGNAVSNAAQASTTLATLEASVRSYNNRITLANTSIVALQTLQNRALSVGSAADIAAIQRDYNAMKAAGQLVTQNDLINAQQNRTSLQSQMSATSQQNTVSLNQCYASR